LKARERELLDQLSGPDNASLQEMLRNLESQHRELIHNQLKQIQVTVARQTPKPTKMIILNPGTRNAVGHNSSLISGALGQAASFHNSLAQTVALSSVTDSQAGAGDGVALDGSGTQMITADGTHIVVQAAESDDNDEDDHHGELTESKTEVIMDVQVSQHHDISYEQSFTEHSHDEQLDSEVKEMVRESVDEPSRKKPRTRSQKIV